MHGMSSSVTPPTQGGTRSRLLTNTGWNVAGQVVPLVVGIAVLPLLIRTMGLDRYGFLTLVWVLVGYASVFDFGIGRALIRVVAMRLARGEEAAAHHVARVGLTFLALFGLAIGAVFLAGSNWATRHLFKLTSGLEHEALRAMWLLAVSVPLVMITTGYVGILSAHQQFRTLNILRALMGLANYLGPLAVALVVNRLDAVVAWVLLLRLIGMLAHAWGARRGCGFRFVLALPDRPSARELLTVGGWMSVSNMVGPLLTYLDRLLLGVMVPMRMVAFYATPFDLTSKAMILPYSMIAAVFPSAAALQPGTEAVRHMLARSMRLLFVMIFPLVFALTAIARPGLRLWLGDDFAQNATPVLQLLALGILLNALAQAPAMLIQAAGQPRLMALLHVTELPLFVGLLYVLTERYGIVGTAGAAALRNGLDALAVWWLARREMARGDFALRGALAPALLAVVLLLAAWWPTTLLEALATLLIGLPLFIAFAWHVVLQPGERARLLQFVGVGG